jgi:hypothetical protein
MQVYVPYGACLKCPHICERDVYVSEPLYINDARGEGDKQTSEIFFKAIDMDTYLRK